MKTMQKKPEQATETAWGVRIGRRPTNMPYIMLNEGGTGAALFDSKEKAAAYAATLTGPTTCKVVRITLSYSAR